VVGTGGSGRSRIPPRPQRPRSRRTSLALVRRQFPRGHGNRHQQIDVFRVHEDGTLSAITVNASSGAVPLRRPLRRMAPDRGGGLRLHLFLRVLPIATSASSRRRCRPWASHLLGRDYSQREFVYTSNAGTSSISGFEIGNNGALTAIGETVVGTNPAGSTNLDIAASANGRFVYTLNSGPDQSNLLGRPRWQPGWPRVGDGLPVAMGMNGIAAY